MTDTPVRVGVVGVGSLGVNHARIYASLEGAELAGIYDVDPERAAYVAAMYKAEVCETLDALMDRIDAASVVVPTNLHFDVASQMIRQGKHLLVEKPIALSVADAERAVAAARANGRVFMVGHVLRFHPAFEHLKSLIDEGELGEVKYIHSHRLGLGKFHTENDALWDLVQRDGSLDATGP